MLTPDYLTGPCEETARADTSLAIVCIVTFKQCQWTNFDLETKRTPKFGLRLKFGFLRPRFFQAPRVFSQKSLSEMGFPAVISAVSKPGSR